MKKTLFIFLVSLAALACQKEGADMTVSRNDMSFDAAAGVQNVTVTTQGQFTVEYTEGDWYTISYSIAKGMGYGSVTVQVEQNKSASSRSGEFVIKTPAKEEHVTFVQSRPAVPSTPEVGYVTLNRLAHSFEIPMPADYEAKAVSNASWIKVEETKAADSWTVTLEPNTTGEAREGEVVIATMDDLTISAVDIEQVAESVLEGELLIDEIYFAGVLLEDGKNATASDGDQYIMLTNNTAETVYADGLLICASSYMSNRSSTGSYWIPQEIPAEGIGINTAYQIPGDGDDVPVLPGASLILAVKAQDFSADGGADLTKAAFEFYYSGSESFPDVDNPDVPNLNLWFQGSFSYFMLHQRGYESYALVRVPDGMDAETFMADHAWTGKEDFYLSGELFRTRDIRSGNYLVPNEWVIDGVNCGVEQFMGDLAFNATVDAGYTGCGKVDSDPDRFGTSARRQTTQEGILADTNNSTNDFLRSAKPSFME